MFFKKSKFTCFSKGKKRAENGTRTRDPNLGKVVLYQLSYFRKKCEEEETRTPTSQLTLPPQSSASTNSATSPLLLRLVENSLLKGPSIQAFCYPSQWVGFDRANVLVSDCECKVTAKCRTSKTFPCFFSCFVVNFLKNGVVCDWFGN